MLSRAHEFLSDQLGDRVTSLRTVERSERRLQVEVTTSGGEAYSVTTGAAPSIRIEIDALLEAGRYGLALPELCGYELDEDNNRGLILTRRLVGTPLARAGPVEPQSEVATQVTKALVAMHSRRVEGWGPLDEAASAARRLPIGSFETWHASATYGMSEALDRIESQRVLQPDVLHALADAVALVPIDPAIEPRRLYCGLSPERIIVTADGRGLVGLASPCETECGDPAREFARWMRGDEGCPVRPFVNSYNEFAPEPIDVWRIWWWAIIEAVRELDRSLVRGVLAPQIGLPVRIVSLLNEAGLSAASPARSRLEP